MSSKRWRERERESGEYTKDIIYYLHSNCCRFKFKRKFKNNTTICMLYGYTRPLAHTLYIYPIKCIALYLYLYKYLLLDISRITWYERKLANKIVVNVRGTCQWNRDTNSNRNREWNEWRVILWSSCVKYKTVYGECILKIIKHNETTCNGHKCYLIFHNSHAILR